MSNKNIRVRVKNILEELNITRAPIDPEMIAEHLGIEIHYEPFEGEISGCLLRDKDGGAIIGINSTHHEHRQRFTIAHEIGHYILHKGEATFIDRKFNRINFRGGSSASTDQLEEIEANKFAGELLMPEEFISKDIMELDDTERDDFLDELAKKYKVSNQALAIRLVNLNLT